MSAIPRLPRLRRFELLEVLGSGATGTVYRARCRIALAGLRPGAEVAVKILHPHLIADRAAREAFLREARAGMRVRHPNLLRIHAVEEVQRPEGRLLYLVLDLLGGRTLRDWLEHDGVAGEPTTRTLGRQIAAALAALHEAGLLHLDIKPENVLWDEDRAVLMDLGFARGPGGGHGGFTGTPAYAAPELLRGGRATPAADLFALGVTLYEAITGVRPFGDEKRLGLLQARERSVVPPPSALQPRTTPFLDAVVLELLAEDPERRFPSAQELAEVLTKGEHHPWWRKIDLPRPHLPAIHPDSLPFLGRDDETRRLQERFAEVRKERNPRVFLLEGQAGVGKSRLALEFGASLRSLPGAPPLLYGRCRQLGGLGRGSALRALRNALTRSLGLVPGELPHVGTERRLRGSLDHESAETLLGILRGRPFPGPKRRRAFRAWLRRLGQEGPFVLFLDDLQHAGGQIWDFLRELIQDRDPAPGADPFPALFLLGYREPLSPGAFAARQRLLQLPATERLGLAPLSNEALRSILERVFAPNGLPDDLAADLIQASRGFPGVLDLQLRLLRQRNQVEGRRGQLRIRDPERCRLPVVRSQRELLATVLRGMPKELRNLLQWAAMLQPPLSVRMLAQLRGVSEVRVVRGLGEARQRGWLKITQGRYRFNLPSHRVAAYESLGPKERRRRHREIYSLLKAAELTLPDREARLAFHAHRGGLYREALHHGLPRVERALRAGALERAEHGLRLLEEDAAALGEDLGPEVAVRLDLLRARLLGLRGETEAEAVLLRKAGKVAQASGAPRLRGLVHFGLALHARELGLAGAARVHADRARILLRGRLPSGANGEESREEA